jgi:undecaprenyl-diphosphatase
MADSALFAAIAPIDLGIVHALNAWVGTSATFDKTLHLLNDNPLFKGLPYVTALWWLSVRKDADGRSDIDVMFMARWISAIIAALVFARVLQHWGPAHARPLTVPELGVTPYLANDPNIMTKLNSFPSDHAIQFFALSLAVWSRSRRLGWIAFAWAFLVILLPRVYFGYHYPSDVVAGALIGVAFMAAFLYAPTPRFVNGAMKRVEGWAPGMIAGAFFLASVTVANNFDDLRQVLGITKGAG